MSVVLRNKLGIYNGFVQLALPSSLFIQIILTLLQVINIFFRVASNPIKLINYSVVVPTNGILFYIGIHKDRMSNLLLLLLLD